MIYCISPHITISQNDKAVACIYSHFLQSSICLKGIRLCISSSSLMCIETWWNSLVRFSPYFHQPIISRSCCILDPRDAKLLGQFYQLIDKIGHKIRSWYCPENTAKFKFPLIVLSGFWALFCRLELLPKCRRNCGPSTLWDSRTNTLMCISICKRLCKYHLPAPCACGHTTSYRQFQTSK